MAIILDNDDPMGNQVIAVDANNGDAQLFGGYLAGHQQAYLNPVFDDSGFANVSTFQDGGPRVNHSLLHDGDTIHP